MTPDRPAVDTVTIGAHTAAVILGPGGFAAWHRANAGTDPEVDYDTGAMLSATRAHIVARSRQTAPARPIPTHDVLVSTRQAARTIGVSQRTIQRWIALGTLPAADFDGHQLIRLADLITRRAA